MTLTRPRTLPRIEYTPRRPYRFYDHDGARHAIPEDLADGVLGQTLCELDVIPVAGRTLGSLPTCWTCEDRWRAAEGLRSRQDIEKAITAGLPKQKGQKS